MKNQWPKFDELPHPTTVRSVLIEEGAGISERTDSEIRFLVESEPFEKGGFLHRCYLVVPKVGYRYPLLRVGQNNLAYPVRIVADDWPDGVNVANEAELRKRLGTLFQSEIVKNLVPQLLELVS